MSLAHWLREWISLKDLILRTFNKLQTWIKHSFNCKERAAAKLNLTDHIFKIDYVLPLTVEECFLSSSENMFDVEAAKRQKPNYK
jgi:hypothetical protein